MFQHSKINVEIKLYIRSCALLNWHCDERSSVTYGTETDEIVQDAVKVAGHGLSRQQFILLELIDVTFLGQ